MGIKDITYAALFDRKDLPFLYRYAEKVRATHSQQLVDDFNNACQRKVDDHNPILGDRTEFMQVSKADDLVVTVGITRLILQITGGSLVRWQWMAKGGGSTTPSAADAGLTAEVGGASDPRIDMSLFGWREWAGSSLRFLAISGESVPTITVNEAGIFDTGPLAGGTMLNKNVFSSLPITHTVNVTGFVISSVIDFVPVMN